MPGHLRQGLPLLEANRAQHPGLNDVEPVLLVMAVGPARRPVPKFRTLVGAVSSFGTRAEDACLTRQD
eukprot:1273527-Amphidinium_carterae.2